LLTHLAGAMPNPAVNVVLAATASEEFGGFGAAVLASRVQADLVICLDATYADKKQGVRLGGGPVLTLSDASVLIGRPVWNVLERLSQAWELPLQTEIYNSSGTDARAFPAQGSLAPVLPLLVASEQSFTAGNGCYQRLGGTCRLADPTVQRQRRNCGINCGRGVW
jgi:putative aminopeptidase FrvX